MAKIIDIAGRITNELPMVRITNELVVTVNNRKNTILNMQAMVNEAQRKAASSGEYDEIALMNKTLVMLVGGKAAEEIESMDLPLPEYKLVYNAIMAAATGAELEEVEQRFQTAGQ